MNFRGEMKTKSILIGIKSSKKWAQALLAFSLMALLLSACAQLTATPSPEPVPQASPQPIATSTTPRPSTNMVVSSAKSVLAEQLQVNIDVIKLVNIQSVQWPDSCLGIHKAGVMCAFHVVDGYQITLSAEGHTYEVRSNLDGSQIALAS
jgi:hypothetical protein